MKVFICSRNIDSEKSSTVIDALLIAAGDSIAIFREEEHSDNWKDRVEKHIKEANFVIFLLGKETFKSDPMKWEYAKAKSLNKQIVGIKLGHACEDSVLFCQGFPIFREIDQCWEYLDKTYTEDRQLLLEQYKIMVASTEKVTDQRMRVNNLFFTVTSSILSVSLVVGKAFEFSLAGSLGMLVLSIMAFVVTFFWEKLVRSYGTLNTGKFTVIDQIEKQLRTNMFEQEWIILQHQIGYDSNTETEVKVIGRFRWFIFAVMLAEFIYILSQIDLKTLYQLLELIKFD
ncbi:TIR domain-containing protein [Teredinibacter turnerae]|uniref:RipA family octameric membrane protein n=1 Tax=Teredinibacter turnerae TaxID=2426 RepID=UPI00041E55C7|nr:TIR domain-containing protein [Teredinibacter turnerae]